MTAGRSAEDGPARVAVVGSGAWGTTLAILIARSDSAGLSSIYRITNPPGYPTRCNTFSSVFAVSSGSSQRKIPTAAAAAPANSVTRTNPSNRAVSRQ